MNPLTDTEKREFIEQFRQLRVADVRDGMDWMLRHDKGTVSSAIRPLWRGARMCGYARTVRYVPTEKVAINMTPEEYTEWAHGYWYGPNGMTQNGLVDDLEQDEIVVMDASDTDVGIIGSNNTLKWLASGAVGVLTNGGVRDTDEVVMQRIPLFSRYVSQTMTQARVEFSDKQVPVNIGGALVRPGDIVVGDGDGVIVVPIEIAPDVLKYGLQELENDKRSRRALYEQLGWEPDDTVR